MRIYITGASATGKSTYAKRVSEELEIPCYHTDQFYDEEKRKMYTLAILNELVPINGQWIIEGSYYIPSYVRKADKVIYMKTSFIKIFYRIWKRWLTDDQTRKNYGFTETVKHSLRTLKEDVFSSDGLDSVSGRNGHFKDRDRFELLKKDARILEIIRT